MRTETTSAVDRLEPSASHPLVRRARNQVMVIPAGGGSHAMPPEPTEGGGIDVGMLLRTLRRRLYIVVALAVLGYFYYQRTNNDITIHVPKIEIKP